VQPNLPDKAIEPHRFRSIVALFIMSLVVWAVASVLIASVREHAD
jgi:capsular polysaccharide transport system permease protein